jgi:uncharacterized membrane protein
MGFDAKKFVIVMLVLLGIDMLWLLTGGQYSVQMHARIQRSPVSFRYAAAIPVYAAMAWLLLQATSVRQAALFGLCAYVIYDFTNYALLDQYDLGFAVADALWGGFLFAAAWTVVKRIGV